MCCVRERECFINFYPLVWAFRFSWFLSLCGHAKFLLYRQCVPLCLLTVCWQYAHAAALYHWILLLQCCGLCSEECLGGTVATLSWQYTLSIVWKDIVEWLQSVHCGVQSVQCGVFFAFLDVAVLGSHGIVLTKNSSLHTKMRASNGSSSP